MTLDELELLLSQAIGEQERGNYDEAVRLSQQVLDALAIETPDVSDTESIALKAGATRLLGVITWRRSDYPAALEQLNAALEAFRGTQDLAGISKTLGNIGFVYFKLSDYSKSLNYFREALQISEAINDQAEASRWTGAIGNVYSQLSDYANALDHLTKALSIAEELDNTYLIASHLGNIGNVHQALADLRKALEYKIKALSINVDLGNRAAVALDTGGIGYIYVELKEYKKALECFDQALSIDEELDNKEGLAVWFGNIGNAHKDLGDFQLALEYFLRALHLSEEIGANWPRLHWLYALGCLYFEHPELSDDSSTAEKYLLQAIADSTTAGVKRIARDSAFFCYRLYKEQARWQEALTMRELAEDLHTEIDIEEVKKQESIRQQQKEIELARVASAAELKATTGLLHRVLPESIAQRIIAGDDEIADYYPSVSILFADIAGFTPISADMPAIIVVRFLNFVFAEFDRIIKKHGCEKIKTIGDGYMAVAGAPLECSDHAERLAAAALEMQQTITLPDHIAEHLPRGVELGIRIGIHTGSIVAGVIGEERFVYDIYSDAVNTAARMESHGEASKIHISNDFYRHLLNRFAMTKNTSHGINFERREEMEIKGKGLMRTYFMHKN